MVNKKGDMIMSRLIPGGFEEVHWTKQFFIERSAKTAKYYNRRWKL